MAPCDFNIMLGRYHDGQLPPEQRRGVAEHLRACPACAAELEQLQSISQSLRAQVMPRASAEFLARLESMAEEVQDVTVLRFVTRLTAVAAAILVVATCQWALVKHQPSPHASAPAVSAQELAIFDPDSVVNNAGNETTASALDPQHDFILRDLSGD